jgi:hypothetical protein
MKIESLGLERRRRHSPERDQYVQYLPFKVSVLRTDARLEEAIELRKDAYDRHYSNVAGIESVHFGEIETRDVQTGNVILLATSKATGELVGSVRVETNNHRPLAVEHQVDLPVDLKGRPLAVVSRFSVVNGKEGLGVFSALGKAMYLFCVAKQIHVVLLYIAIDSLERFYPRFGFERVGSRDSKIQFEEYPGMQFSAYVWRLTTLHEKMRDARLSRTYYDFLFEKMHPDIEIFSSVASIHEVRRTTDQPAAKHLMQQY